MASIVLPESVLDNITLPEYGSYKLFHLEGCLYQIDWNGLIELIGPNYSCSGCTGTTINQDIINELSGSVISQLTEINHINAQVNTLEEGIQTIDSNLSGINENISSIDSNLNEVNNNINTINNGIVEIDSNINVVGRRVNNLEDGIQSIDNNINEVSGSITTLESTIDDTIDDETNAFNVRVITLSDNLFETINGINTQLKVLTTNLLLCNYTPQLGSIALETKDLCSQIVTGTRINAIQYPNPILIYTGATFGIVDNTFATDIILGETKLKYNDKIDDEYFDYNPNAKINFAMNLPHLVFFSGAQIENTTYITNHYYKQNPNLFFSRIYKTSNIIEIRIPYFLKKIRHIDLSNNSLSVISIEHILTHLDLTEIKRGVVNLTKNPNTQNLTANSNVAKTNLILKGWSVQL